MRGADALPLPWRKPRNELALLVLVGVVALLPVYTFYAQDQSRLCLAQAFEHARLSNDACFATSVDKARYGAHLYSDKAPGMSVLELPLAAATRLPPAQRLDGTEFRVWLIRVATSGVAFLLGVFLVGRTAEGLAPGWGGAAIVAFGLGTLYAPLAATSFSHVAAGTTAFAAFLLAWRRRHAAAGLAVGAAVLLEYQTAAILLLLGAYVAVRRGRAVLRYAAGAAPAIVLLLVYDALAFGSPFHLSYRYVVGSYAQRQASGFFGISRPRLHSIHEVFVGNRGILLVSPLVVAAAYGIVVLARQARAEAAVCGAVTLFFVVLNCGYFLPYGGGSPGPRFLVPALPFLALGLGPAFRRHPWPTSLLAVASVVPTVALTLVWTATPPMRHTIWQELWHVVAEGRSSHLVRHLVGKTALGWIGSGGGALVIVVAAAAAAALAFLPRAERLAVHRWRAAAVALAAAALLATAVRAALMPLDLRTTISASRLVALPGDEVDLDVALANRARDGFTHVRLVIDLPPGAELLGAPVVERGPGCTGTSTVTCDLDFLESHMSTHVRLGIRVAADAPPKLKVRAHGLAGSSSGPSSGITLITGSG